MKGSVFHHKYLNKKKKARGMDIIESSIPSPKTSRTSIYKTYVKYILTNLDALFTFYGCETAKDYFMLYQGRQRVQE
ncbi:MAG: hypothetical protein EXX96DRAFT_544879 [Benjaminiella poitrasii]|nr:MAG: hypothetical protein EXX96DRAFT_544879 [Benjaminiella poitrasii]